MRTRWQSYLIATAILVIGLAVVGWLLAVRPLQREVARVAAEREQLVAERDRLAKQLRHFGAASGSTRLPIRMLAPGDEHHLLRVIYDQASAANLQIASLTMLELAEVSAEPMGTRDGRSDGDGQTGSGPAGSSGGAGQGAGGGAGGGSGVVVMPELDANGMPIGAATDEAPEDLPLRLLPIDLRVRGSFRAWVVFLEGAEKNLPGFRVRRLEYDGGGDLVKGRIQLVFPVTEAGGGGAAGAGGRGAGTGSGR